MGDSLFINMMPLECVQGLLIRPEYGGLKYDHELPGYFKGNIRVVARGQTYQDASTLINSVLGILPAQEATIGTAYVRFLRPVTQPQTFPVTRANYFEALLDLEISYSENS